MRIVIVTGLSGAGKSTALRALEDYGYFCIDNLPLPMLRAMVEWLETEGRVKELAVAVDARQHEYLDDYQAELGTLSSLGHRLDVLYLDADDECLVRRYSATRRLHPLAADDLTEGIRRDRKILDSLRSVADVIDTSRLNVHQLKAIIQDRYSNGHNAGLSVVLQSFGFKHGLPRESNLVFDVRFLRNPYFDPVLTDRDGRDAAVSRYVLDTNEAKTMVDHVEGLLRFTIPEFERERKLYLTVAIGCTGGRHRSVAVVEELHRRLKDRWNIVVKHRDLDLRT